MVVVTIKTKGVGKLVSKNGRVRVRFGDGREYSLDVARIREVNFFNGEFYIVYETDSADFYRQHAVPEIPRLAIKLRFVVKEEKIFVCSVCGAEIEWDADEPFCPNFCDERYDDWDYRETVKRYLVVEPDGDEVAQFIEKLLGIKIVEKTAELYWTVAGGFRPMFELTKIDAHLYGAHVTGVAVIESPAFRESHWDEHEVYVHKFEGRFIAVEYRAGDSWYVALFKFSGEPDTSLLMRLHEEWRQKEERRKEEQEKVLEEIERRRKEEEQRWGDPARVIDAIRKAMPDWADGAVVIARRVGGFEDADVAYEVYPVKRSQRGGGYYYSPGWRALSTGVPERFLERLADTVILRNGTIVEVKNKRQNGSGKYVTLET
jgi:endogenous inhibitor of DNA gyrase (YacG/DUF329 family)